MKRRNFLTAIGISLVGGNKLLGQTISNINAFRKKRAPIIKTRVLVVGGGPAGIGAAIGAAKAGAETLLIENYGFMGGVASWSIGMPMNQMRPNGEPRGFVHEYLLRKLTAYGDQAVRVSSHQFYVNAEYLKVAILDALEEVGCKYLVHLKAVDALRKGNRVTGVIVSTKSGLAEIKADVVVDCTGDADIAYFAGAPTMIETERISPQTLLLNIGNVDYYSRDDMSGVVKSAKFKYPLIPHNWNLNKVSNCHHYYINHAGTKNLGIFDITDPYQFSKAECLSRRQVIQMTETMREFGSCNLRNCELVGASTQVGVRESRRIKGGYILTEEDAMSGKKFDDAIAWRSGWLDIGYTRLTKMKIHQVPYRALVPEQIDNLFAAGRCISASHEGASAGKSMGNCFATGHAAGVAAALCSKEKKVPRELKVETIQKILTNDGVDLTKGGESQCDDMAN
jgi:hypothetical protein